jgi:hypothetical protein
MLGRAIAAVRVNAVRADGERWIKRRRAGMAPVIALGNVFLRLSRSRIQMFASCPVWQAWEVAAMRALHGAGAARCESRRAIATRHVPGDSLRDRLAHGTVAPELLVEVGREFARAHALSIGGHAFSHGDPHTGNILYDDAAQRARLIDVETRHDPALGARDRHADDLLVLLLDLLGRAPETALPVLARALLAGYRRRDVIEALEPRLALPRGLERALWATRTCFVPRDVLAARLELLRDVAIAAARPREPMSSCKVAADR